MSWPIQRDPMFGCWLWTGKLAPDGYGLVWRGKRPSYAHRVVYEAEVGPVPDGQVLDHACRRRHCVNPIHLEPVTEPVNQQRKAWRMRVRRATCARGHDLKLHAVVTPEGGRVCRQCIRDQQGAPS